MSAEQHLPSYQILREVLVLFKNEWQGETLELEESSAGEIQHRHLDFKIEPDDLSLSLEDFSQKYFHHQVEPIKQFAASVPKKMQFLIHQLPRGEVDAVQEIYAGIRMRFLVLFNIMEDRYDARLAVTYRAPQA